MLLRNRPHRPRYRPRRFSPAAALTAASFAASGCVSADAGDPPPARETATVGGPAPVTPAAPTDPQAEQLLDALEAAAADHRTLTARVRMRSIQDLLDDETTRFGDLAWARGDETAGTPTRFAVAFDRLKTLDGPLEAVDRRYVYDGRWLLDVDGAARTATRRELNASETGGEAESNPGEQLTLGDGPFLVPLNLKKDRVLARFDASVAAPHPEDDPADGPTDRLVLVPRDTTDIDAVRLDLWFDRTTRLPRRVVGHQADGDRTVVDLFETDVNPDVPDGRFDTDFPADAGWELQTVPLTPTR